MSIPFKKIFNENDIIMFTNEKQILVFKKESDSLKLHIINLFHPRLQNLQGEIYRSKQSIKGFTWIFNQILTKEHDEIIMQMLNKFEIEEIDKIL